MASRSITYIYVRGSRWELCIKHTISISCRGAIRILHCYWNKNLPRSILPLNKHCRGLRSADLSAQLLRNRQGWLQVPHIANMGVFNEGVGVCDHGQGFCERSSDLTARASWEAEHLQCYDLAVWQLHLEDSTKNVRLRSAVAAINHATFSWTPQPAERLIRSRQQEPLGIKLSVTVGVIKMDAILC